MFKNIRGSFKIMDEDEITSTFLKACHGEFCANVIEKSYYLFVNGCKL